LATIPRNPCFVTDDDRGALQTIQTFSLDASAQLLITVSLLDRFLACMKPASITYASFVLAFFLAKRFFMTLSHAFKEPVFVRHMPQRSNLEV
jgi:hypothetical protein